MIAADVRATWERNQVALHSWTMFVLYNFAVGLTLVVDGPEGISTPSFAIIRDYLGDNLWGAGLIVLAVLIAASVAFSARTVALMVGVGAVAHLLLAAGVLAAVREVPRVEGLPAPAPLGVWAYVFVAGAHGINVALYWRGGSRGGTVG